MSADEWVVESIALFNASLLLFLGGDVITTVASVGRILRRSLDSTPAVIRDSARELMEALAQKSEIRIQVIRDPFTSLLRLVPIIKANH